MLIQENLKIMNYHSLSSLHRLMVMHSAVDRIMRAKDQLHVESIWLAHNEKDYKSLFTHKSVKYQVDAIYQYFGPQISLYFAWVHNYTKNLMIPAVSGVLVFAHQWWTQQIDSRWLPFYAILIALWSTAFLEFWKRRSSALSARWNVFGVEDDELDEELAKAVKDEKSDRMMRLGLSFLASISIIVGLLKLMLYFVDFHMRSDEIYGPSSWLRYYPTLIYSVLPVILPLVFEPIAIYLNNFESHSTKAQEEKYMILKKFALQFVNRYCALLYVAFWRRDLDKLRSLLISLLTTGAVINNGMELGMPYLKPMLEPLLKRFASKLKSKTKEVQYSKKNSLGSD
jgi:anoctamin-10